MRRLRSSARWLQSILSFWAVPRLQTASCTSPSHPKAPRLKQSLTIGILAFLVLGPVFPTSQILSDSVRAILKAMNQAAPQPLMGQVSSLVSRPADLPAAIQLLADERVSTSNPRTAPRGVSNESRAASPTPRLTTDTSTSPLPWSSSTRHYPGQITVDPSFPCRAKDRLDTGIPVSSADAGGADNSKHLPQSTQSSTTRQPTKSNSPPTAASGTTPTSPSSSSSTSGTTPSDSNSAWPRPQALLDNLTRLPAHPQVQAWGHSVQREIEHLSATQGPADQIAKTHLAKLQLLLQKAPLACEPLTDDDDRGTFWRVAYDLARQTAAWISLGEIDQRHSLSRQPTAADLQLLAERLTAVRTRVDEQEHSANWIRFLQLDAARQFPLNPAEITDQHRLIAYEMLNRLDSQNLAEPQQLYLREPTFLAWRESLRTFAQRPLDTTRLLHSLEQFEQNGSDSDNQQLARAIQTLQWSPRAADRQLAEPLSDHYRNANLRVAIAGDLINRLLHEPTSVDEPVDDIIRNARVRGQSHTNARVRVELLPDRRQWRLGLEARGDVASTTESRKGPATFLQDAWSNFSARKQLTVDRRGVRTETAEANARSSSDLRGFSTDYDHVPLFGLMARAVARNQYHDQLTAAQSEVEQRVADRARQRLDEEVTQRLSDAEGEFHRKWLRPLQRLGLDPTAVDMETTPVRLIVRYRLASGEQLAAHTARPQAPANSWLSVQIHQSAINNTLAQLAFEGRRFTVAELYRELAERFDRPTPELPEDLPDDISVRFADQESVRVRCDDNRVTIELRIAELAQGTKNRWKNFTVRAQYMPVINQRDASLVRDGIIEISGEKRSLGNQVILRTIFAKVLSKNRPINLMNESLVKTPQLADLEVNQVVLLDGWLGVALAPKLEVARNPTAPGTSTSPNVTR